MSRIGKAIINIPAGVDIKISADNVVTVKGPKGELHQPLKEGFKIKIEDNIHEPEIFLEQLTLLSSQRWCHLGPFFAGF